MPTDRVVRKRLRTGERRSRGQQIHNRVELPERIRYVARRGADLEEAVDFLRPVTIGDVTPVRADVELIDGGADRRGAREPPGDNAPPVVARPHIRDKRTALV